MTEADAPRPPARPIASGGSIALAAALAFGGTTPLIQRIGRGVGPFATAGLLYAGAALFSVTAIRRTADAPLRPTDASRVAVAATLGAVLAPAALAWGLQRTSGVTASLLLNLEALFTAGFAALFWLEPIGIRVSAALCAMVAGGAVLIAEGTAPRAAAEPLGAGGWGAAAVVVATVAWAGDNTVARPLADRDPVQVVLAKAAVGAVASTVLGLARGDAWPRWSGATALVLLGAVGYGASLRLYLRAQRAIGAARTASLFAAAPFVGAAIAWAMGERAAPIPTAFAVGLCAMGVWLHLTETHEHAHSHEAIDHSHVHRHDDGHHEHAHDGDPTVEHSHPHSHAPLTHAHPHGMDPHHRHRHD